MRRSIGFTTRALSGTTGAAHSAVDSILALSRAGADVHLRTFQPSLLPARVDGVDMGPWRVVAPPWPEHLRAVLTRNAPPSSLVTFARLRLTAAGYLSSDPTTEIEVINGLGADALFRQLVPHNERPTVLIVRESPRHFDDDARVEVAAEAMRRHGHVVFVSEVGRREWIVRAKLDPARTSHIPNCVLEERARALRAGSRQALARELGLDSGKVHAVCVGSIQARKGQDLLLDALERLGPRAPELHVTFIGPLLGEFGRNFAARVAKSPIRPSCTLLGPLEDPYPHIYAADFLVLASRAEAMPRVVLEAMALGTCVLASDTDGMREQIVDGETGLLAPVGDSVALSERMRALLDDAPRRQALGEAGRSRYEACFARERQAAAYAALLERLR